MMLDILRDIIEKCSYSNELPEFLDIIVHEINTILKIEASAIFLLDKKSNNYILAAQNGFKLNIIKPIVIPKDSGLIGLIGNKKEVINLEKAISHPSYLFLKDLNEDTFNGFLGAPIIHQDTVLGVIIMEHKTTQKFTSLEESFLITLAAHLANIISNTKFSESLNNIFQEVRADNKQSYNGITGCPGIAIGKALILHDLEEMGKIPDKKIAKNKITYEIKKFKKAIEISKQEIIELTESFKDTLPKNEFNLFSAYLTILDEDFLLNETIDEIRNGNWAKGALKKTIFHHIAKISAIEDEYLKERANDLADLGKKILSNLDDNPKYQKINSRQTILVGKKLTITDLANVNYKKLKGIISCDSSYNSHITILARALNIPAIINVDGLNLSSIENKNLILDAHNGTIYISPDRNIINKYNKVINADKELYERLKKYNKYKTKTKDGVEFKVLANSNLLTDIEKAKESNPYGVGLYRSEIPFLISNSIPNENEQLKIYLQVLKTFHPKKVTIRVLDIGGDKSLPYLPIKEDNPYLGWRGIRILLDHPEIFTVQLKALLKANYKLNNLKIMLSMVSSETEVIKSIDIIKKVYRDLKNEMPYLKLPPIGILLEVPSLLYELNDILDYIDFVSVGTNDLIQYLYAVDRNNNNVQHLYNPFNPGVLRALNQIAKICNKKNKSIGICGEIAADPLCLLYLIAMGYKNLSVNYQSINKIKLIIKTVSHSDAKKLLAKILKYKDSQKIKKALILELQKLKLDEFLRI